MKNIDEQLELLGKIESVEPPFFLFSKVQSKILEANKLNAPKRTVFALGGLATCCLLITLFVGLKSYNKAKTESVATSIELLPTNNFYDE